MFYIFPFFVVGSIQKKYLYNNGIEIIFELFEI